MKVKESIDLIEDKSLIPVFEKVLDGRRLSFKDGLKILRSRDILTIGEMASYVNEKINGKNVYL